MFSITIRPTRKVNRYTQGEIVTQSQLKSPLVPAFFFCYLYDIGEVMSSFYTLKPLNL